MAKRKSVCGKVSTNKVTKTCKICKNKSNNKMHGKIMQKYFNKSNIGKAHAKVSK